MATGVNVKLGVSGVNDFKRGMKDAETSVKTLESAMKLNDAAMKESGNSEQYLKNKTELLKDAIKKQTEAVQQAQRALEAMRRDGVDESSSAFQKMQKSAYDAQTKLTEMKNSLKGVEDGAPKANSELKKIGQGIDWQNVTTGLDSIISKLESGARAAMNFGKKIISSAKGSTGWADDLLTLSAQTDTDVITLQKIDKVAHILETDAEAIAQAKQRMARATQNDKGVESIEEVLGVKLTGQSADDLFWEIGEALANMGEEFDKETAAQKVFGRSWHELLPLFKLGREEYEKLLDAQTYLSEEDVQKLGKADDAIKSIEKEWQQMKNQFWADNADKITELMQWLIDNKESVVSAVTAIAGAFGLLKLGSLALNIGKVVNGLSGLTGGGEASGADVAATGTGGSPRWASILNKATLFAAAGAMYEATTGKIKQVWSEFQNAAAGMDAQESSVIALMHDLGISEEEARKMVLSPGSNASVNTQQSKDWRPSYMQGKSYYNGPGQGDEVVHKDRRGQSTFEDYSDSLNRMAAAAEQTNTNTQQIAQNSVTGADIRTLTGLPAAVASAVRSGMAGVTIVISDGAISSIGRRTGRMLGDQVKMLTK